MELTRTYLPLILTTLFALQGCNTEGKIDAAPPFDHKNNVFAEVDNWYVNSDWTANVGSSDGGAIARQSTAVWLYSTKYVDLDAPEIEARWPPATDPTAIVDLNTHFKRSEAQGNALLQLVLNNAPEKACSSELTTGELDPSEEGFRQYQTDYIDPIAKIVSNYPQIPVAVIVEPHTWTNSVINSESPDCMLVSNKYTHGYTNAIRYAINTLSALKNVHIYLDIGSANHLGWDNDFQLLPLFAHGIITGFDGMAEQAKLIGDAIELSPTGIGKYTNIGTAFVEPPRAKVGDTSPPGYARIDGFVSNVGEYVPLNEPYLSDPSLPKNDQPLSSARFYEGNPRFDEWTFTQDWMNAIAQLSPSDTTHLGVLIDTSRNGWGLAQKRLVGAAVTRDISELDSHRIDQREHRQSWCNQAGGIGKRPQANPDKKSWIDAYVWVKAPGESDGVSDQRGFSVDPNEYFRGDEMCNPNGKSRYAEQSDLTAGLGVATGAMPNAPKFADWFENGFKVLLDNAWPPLCSGVNDEC